MVDLLKAFGRGILYVLACPFFVLGLVIFALIGLLAFIFQLFKSIIYFFTGQKFFPELPEDRELRLKREKEEALRNPAPQPAYQEAPVSQPAYQEAPISAPASQSIYPNNPNPAPTQSVNNDVDLNNFVNQAPVEEEKQEPVNSNSSIEEACFGKEEDEEEPVKELGEDSLMGNFDDEPSIDDELLGGILNNQDDEEEEEEEEELEMYQPKGSNYSDEIEDDDDSEDNGVHIGFDN